MKMEKSTDNSQKTRNKSQKLQKKCKNGDKILLFGICLTIKKPVKKTNKQ